MEVYSLERITHTSCHQKDDGPCIEEKQIKNRNNINN